MFQFSYSYLYFLHLVEEIIETVEYSLPIDDSSLLYHLWCFEEPCDKCKNTEWLMTHINYINLVSNCILNPEQNGECLTNPLTRLQISSGWLQLPQVKWKLFLRQKTATVRTVGNLLLTTGICLTRTITTLRDLPITLQWGQWTSLTIRWNIFVALILWARRVPSMDVFL